MPQAQTEYDANGHFLLAMPLSKADEARAALAAVGVPFNPEAAVTGWTDLVGMSANFTGHNLDEVVDAINRHQKETGEAARIAVPASDMTLADRHAVLTFSVQRCFWTDHEPPYVDEIDPEGWDQLREEHPHLVA